MIGITDLAALVLPNPQAYLEPTKLAVWARVGGTLHLHGGGSLAGVEGGGLRVQQVPLGLYAAQLALNLAWTPIFFKAHRIKLALVDISALLVLVVLTASKFSTVIGMRTTALLMGPYLLWSAFAAALTYSILALNPSAKAGRAVDHLPPERHFLDLTTALSLAFSGPAPNCDAAKLSPSRGWS
ncbi:MAG: hypothetical protein WDW36_009015 [Sanguina aurantia]